MQKQQATKAILLVEDDAAIGAFLTEAIGQETSYQATLVTNPFHALKVVKDLNPDLFILDYQLPGMNGIELYDLFHSVQALHHIPTIMISAILPMQEIAQRSIVGLTKPLDFNEFLNAIESLLSR